MKTWKLIEIWSSHVFITTWNDLDELGKRFNDEIESNCGSLGKLVAMFVIDDNERIVIDWHKGD